MRLTKKEKIAAEAEQEYIRKARSIFKFLLCSHPDGITARQLADEFDRLGVKRTGITFAAIMIEAVDGGLKIRD